MALEMEKHIAQEGKISIQDLQTRISFMAETGQSFLVLYPEKLRWRGGAQAEDDIYSVGASLLHNGMGLVGQVPDLQNFAVRAFLALIFTSRGLDYIDTLLMQILSYQPSPGTTWGNLERQSMLLLHNHGHLQAASGTPLYSASHHISHDSQSH